DGIDGAVCGFRADRKAPRPEPCPSLDDGEGDVRPEHHQPDPPDRGRTLHQANSVGPTQSRFDQQFSYTPAIDGQSVSSVSTAIAASEPGSWVPSCSANAARRWS